MGLSTDINSGTVYDQIRTLQTEIDECKAFCEVYRDKVEQIGEILTAARQLNDDIQSPHLLNAESIYEKSCSELRASEAKLHESLIFLRMILQEIKQSSIECVQYKYGNQLMDYMSEHDI